MKTRIIITVEGFRVFSPAYGQHSFLSVNVTPKDLKPSPNQTGTFHAEVSVFWKTIFVELRWTHPSEMTAVNPCEHILEQCLFN